MDSIIIPLGFLGIILNLKIIQKRCKDTTYYGNSQTFWRKKSMTCPLDPLEWRWNTWNSSTHSVMRVLILVIMEWRWNSLLTILCCIIFSLNPCYNGMTMEFEERFAYLVFKSLNPCYNGMTMEFSWWRWFKRNFRVLILVIMEWRWNSFCELSGKLGKVLILVIMEWRWNSPIIYRFGTLFKFLVSLMPHILNNLRQFCPIFRKCLKFLRSNPGFWNVLKCKLLIISNMRILKISQILCDNSYQMDSCENHARFYWVLRPQNYSFFANDANFLVFFFICEENWLCDFVAFLSNASKSGFWEKLIFRKWFCAFYCINKLKIK